MWRGWSSYCTLSSCSPLSCGLNVGSASNKAKFRHICKHTHSKCRHYSLNVPHAATAGIYRPGCVGHLQNQQWEKRKWVMSNIIWTWCDSVSPSLVIEAKESTDWKKEGGGGGQNSGSYSDIGRKCNAVVGEHSGDCNPGRLRRRFINYGVFAQCEMWAVRMKDKHKCDVEGNNPCH